MSPPNIHQQLHGYRKGHQLLSASLVLEASDQDVVNRLSDLTGRLRPGELFDPYLTAYPLPSLAYYVVARTFQDLEAPRSGCVLTRSLLIPMDAWVELQNLEWLLTMLVGIREGEEPSPRQNPGTRGMPPKKVSDPRVAELVNALFLDDTRAIVVFDAPEAELIAARLLVALWPSLRRRFSLCTLAFAPRRLGDRDFDLHFAPISVQSRFSSEGFYRIGVRGALPRETVHHLAAPIAKRIFDSDEPRLTAPDMLGLFDEDELGDRSAVRIVLRWEELASRAKTTPTAVLGMLDIMNSSGGPGYQGWECLSPLVSAALGFATVHSSPRECWNFFIALIAKVRWDIAPAGLAENIYGALRSLAQTDPKEALAFMDEMTTGAHVPAALLKGVGDGVAESSSFEALSECLSRLEPTLVLRLVAASDRLGEALVAAVNSSASRWLYMLVHVFEGEDVDARHQVLQRLLCLVDDSVAAKVIPSMLADVGGTDLADLAVDLAGRGKFRSHLFSAAFAKATRNSRSVEVVRDAVMVRIGSADIDALLLELVEPRQSDVEWLLGLNDGVVAGRLLTGLLADADETAILSLLSKRTRAPQVVSVLRAVLPSSAPQIARILALDLIRGEPGLDVGFEVVSMLSGVGRQALETWLLREVLSAAPLGDSRLAYALAAFGTGLRANELVAAATAVSIGPRRVSRNLEALNDAPQDVRMGVVGAADVLCQHLVERRWEKLGEAAYQAWAAMLTDAGVVDTERRIKATAVALGFALRHVSYPVSPLVVASFSTVYRELPKLRKLGLRSYLIPAFSNYWMSSKNPKDDRRELIDALVSAFFNSSWPPADLIVAAIDADVGKRVVKRVSKRFSGARYLERIERDTRRLDDELRCRVLACLPETE